MTPRIAVIPARGGSKGIYKKNLSLIGCQPLIQWAIDSVHDITQIDEIFVSTDDSDIAEISRSAGVKVSIRPKKIAEDNSRVEQAVEYIIENDLGGLLDSASIVLLQPTSPFRTREDILGCLELHSKTRQNICSVVSVNDPHPARMYRTEPRYGFLRSYLPKYSAVRRQDLPQCLLRNGAVYICNYKRGREFSFINNRMIPYIMPISRSINIDTIEDLEYARFLASLTSHVRTNS